MTPLRAALIVVVAGAVAFALARHRRNPFGIAVAAAGGVFLAAYGFAFASGYIDCADDGSCGPLRGELRLAVVLSLLAVPLAALAGAIRAGLRPIPLRTARARARRRPALRTKSNDGPLRAGRPEDAFAPDLGLQLRMVVALGLAGAVVAGVLAGLAFITVKGGWPFMVFIAGFAAVGLSHARKAPPIRGRRGAREPHRRDGRHVRDVATRLCVVGGLKAPEILVERSRLPLSWTTSPLRRRPTVHVTTGLLDRLAPAELEAVVAHELSHIANRDGLIVTLIAAPSATFFGGLRWMIEDDWFRGTLAVVVCGLWLVPAALLMSACARLVSRHRELTADRGAAVLTGSPAAVASALTSVADGLSRLRKRDLRRAATGDVFHLLPARPDEPGPLGQLWSTHPRLHRRLAQLEEMEERLQAGRAEA